MNRAQPRTTSIVSGTFISSPRETLKNTALFSTHRPSPKARGGRLGAQPLSMKFRGFLPFLISACMPEVSGSANLAGSVPFLDSIVTFTVPAGTWSTRNLPSLILPPTNWSFCRWNVITPSSSGLPLKITLPPTCPKSSSAAAMGAPDTRTAQAKVRPRSKGRTCYLLLNPVLSLGPRKRGQEVGARYDAHRVLVIVHDNDAVNVRFHHHSR